MNRVDLRGEANTKKANAMHGKSFPQLKGPPIIMRRGRTIRHPLYYETKGSLDDGYAEMRVIYMLLRAYIMRRVGIIMRRGLEASC